MLDQRGQDTQPHVCAAGLNIERSQKGILSSNCPSNLHIFAEKGEREGV